MVDVDKKREATASIRGYFYQLDAALLDIFAADLHDEVVIEGIEDFDRYSSDGIIYNQVKYYESQNLTYSLMREPVHKLFLHFWRLQEKDRAGRKYVLYGNFKEIKVPLILSSADDFRKLMAYTVRPKNGPAVSKSLLDDVNADDSAIEAFCAVFEVKEAEKFDEHRAAVIDAVRKNQSVSKAEAEGFHYPRALNFIALLATKKLHTERTTTLLALQQHLNGTQAIHHRWLLRERESLEYTRLMRRMYFESANSAGVLRAFLIEVCRSTDADTVCDQIRQMAKKWSSAEVRRLAISERYAPYVLLRNATDTFLSEVKNKLFETGMIFVDGYPHRGSQFQVDHINTSQTDERKIALRFSDSWDQLMHAISTAGRKLPNVFDFYIERPIDSTLGPVVA